MIRAYFEGHAADGVPVATAEELADVLARVEAAGPTQSAHLMVGDPPSRVLTVGLNGDRGVVRYATDGGEAFSKNPTPYAVPEQGEVLYWLDTAELFFPDDAEVPRADVIEIARQFLTSGGARPLAVEPRA